MVLDRRVVKVLGRIVLFSKLVSKGAPTPVVLGAAVLALGASYFAGESQGAKRKKKAHKYRR